MRHEVHALNIHASDANAGTAKEISNLIAPTIYLHQVAAGDAFDLKIQVKVSTPQDSNDDWVDFTVGLIAPTLLALADAATGAPLPITHVRVYRTSIAAGVAPPYVNVAGFNAHTE